MKTIKGFIRKYFDPKNKSREIGGMTIGVNHTTGEYINLTAQEAAHGTFILGCGCSGKKHGVIKLIEESIHDGNGVVAINSDGWVHAHASYQKMANEAGRSSDLYLLDLTNKIDGDEIKNSWNPFSTMNAQSMLEMICSALLFKNLDDQVGLKLLLKSVLEALVYKRDQLDFKLDAQVILNHLNMKSLLALSESLSNHALIYFNFNEYIAHIVQYDQENLNKHAYFEIIIERYLLGLIDNANVFMQGTSEINIEKIIYEKNILLVVLPCIEKCGEEYTYLGKMVLSAIDGAIKNTASGEFSPLNTRIVLNDVGRYGAIDFESKSALQLGIQFVYVADSYAAINSYQQPTTSMLPFNCETRIFLKNCEREDSFKLLTNQSGGVIDIEKLEKLSSDCFVIRQNKKHPNTFAQFINF